MEVRLDYKKLILQENKLKTFYLYFTKKKIIQTGAAGLLFDN